MTLRDEILAGGYNLQTMTDQQIADAISVNRVRLGEVSRAKFAIWAATGPRSVIEDEAADKTSPFRASALTLKDLLSGAADSLDLSDSSVGGLLNQWKLAEKISQAEYDSLVALATHADPVGEFEVRQLCWLDDGTRALKGE